MAAARSRPLYKIVILGDGAVGKSCLTIQFTQSMFVVDYDPTIENSCEFLLVIKMNFLSYRKQHVVDGATCMLDIIDTAGQEEYRVLQDQYIHRGEGFLLIYSVTSRLSFELIPKFQQKIFMVKGETVSYPMVIVGNKSDLTTQREVSPTEGLTFAQSVRAPFFETSAVTRKNVDEVFVQCIREIQKRRDKESGYDAEGERKEGNKKKSCAIL